VFATAPQLRQRIAAGLARVLIIDPQPAQARLLADLLRGVSRGEVAVVSDFARGQAATRAMEPQLIFIEHPAYGVDGYGFTRDLRRGDSPSRKTPVIMATAEATAAAILAARDCGVHEFMRKPFTMKDLERRLEAVLLKPRDWVEGLGYVGPDRRRFNSADYQGPRKRRADARQDQSVGRLQQALQIVRAAAVGYESDPRQARRALQTQVTVLKPLIAVYPAMASAVVALEVWDLEHPEDSAASTAEMRRRAAALEPFMPNTARAA
jgi:DNA-binding response OmpR family regulator